MINKNAAILKGTINISEDGFLLNLGLAEINRNYSLGNNQHKKEYKLGKIKHLIERYSFQMIVEGK